MFECKYKFELSDSITSAKYVYKSQKRKRDVVLASLIPILILCMIAMMVYDVVNGRSFVWDLVLIIALCVLGFSYLLIPIMLVNSQKSAYKKQSLEEMDFLLVSINDNLCTEEMFKDGEVKAKSVHNLKSLTSYLEDKERLVLVFNKIEFVCLRKENITGGVEKLKNHLKKIMNKTQKTK